MQRTYNTLFMLSSVDGKISTGAIDDRDVDKDYKNIPGIKEGLHQYYDLEKETDMFSFNTGKVMAKIGANTKFPISNPYVTFVIVDNTHLTKKGITNMCKSLKALVLVTKNPKHPAFSVKYQNLSIITYTNEVNFTDLFSKLYSDYSVERITIQSGGTLNSLLIREGLIDEVSIVYAPALVGGKDTPSLMDGSNLVSEEDLSLIKTLKLIDIVELKDSYVNLKYLVNNSSHTKI